MGNEACDLDSMAASVLYAYLLHALQLQGRPSTSSPPPPPAAAAAAAAAVVVAGVVVVVPVMNITREEFELRGEAPYVFGRAGIDTRALVFLDEIDLVALHESQRLHLTLVDHN